SGDGVASLTGLRGPMLLAVGTEAVLTLPAAVRPVIGANGQSLSLILLGLLVFVLGRRREIGARWLVGTPAAVTLATDALFVRRELRIYIAILAGHTFVVAVVAAIGALAARRGGRVHA